MSTNLLVHEGKLGSIHWNQLWREEAENLEEQLPLLASLNQPESLVPINEWLND